MGGRKLIKKNGNLMRNLTKRINYDKISFVAVTFIIIFANTNCQFVSNLEGKNSDALGCNGLLFLKSIHSLEKEKQYKFSEDEICQMRSLYTPKYPLYILVDPIITVRKNIGIFKYICYTYTDEVSFEKGYRVLKLEDTIYINNGDSISNVNMVNNFIKIYGDKFNSAQKDVIYNEFTK
jgi:hypothetical protein